MTYETSFSADARETETLGAPRTSPHTTLERPRFFGGPAALFLPLALFVATTFALFSVEQAFDLYGLAAAGLAALFAGALLSKTPALYWKAAVAGAASTLTGTVVLLLLAAGVFSAVVKAGGAAGGIVYLGNLLNLSGNAFTVFALLAATLFGTATGSSIGTLLTAVPLLFPAGVALGADASLLAGALLSGAVFGDHLSPVSDVTVISAMTQRTTDGRSPEIGTVVTTSLPHALPALGIALLGYAFLSGDAQSVTSAASGATHAATLPQLPKGDAAGLAMLLPVFLLIAVAVRTRDVLTAAGSGIVSGLAIGLATGRFGVADILGVHEGTVSGILYSGVTGMGGIILLCITLFAFTEVVTRSGLGEAAVEKLLGTNTGTNTPVNTHTDGALRMEVLLAAATFVVTTLFAAVTSASTALVGVLANDPANRAGLDPLRRAHLLTGFANGLPVLMPFSAFVLILTGILSGLPGGEAVTPVALSVSSFYPIALTAVLVFSVTTGFGRHPSRRAAETVSSPTLSAAVPHRSETAL